MFPFIQAGSQTRSEMILINMHLHYTKAGVFWRVGEETRCWPGLEADPTITKE